MIKERNTMIRKVYLLLLFLVWNSCAMYGMDDKREKEIQSKMAVQRERKAFLNIVCSVPQPNSQQQENKFEDLKVKYGIDGLQKILLYVQSGSHSNDMELTIMPGVKEIHIYISQETHSNKVVLNDIYCLKPTNQPKIFCNVEAESHSNSICLYSWNEWNYTGSIAGHSNNIVVRAPWRRYTRWFGATVFAAGLLYYIHQYLK